MSQVDKTTRALESWKLIADMRRQRWEEAEANRQLRSHERQRRMRAVQFGLAAGTLGCVLVASGYLFAVSRTEQKPVEGPDGLTLWNGALTPVPPPEVPRLKLPEPNPISTPPEPVLDAPPEPEPTAPIRAPSPAAETNTPTNAADWIVEPGTAKATHKAGETYYGAAFETRYPEDIEIVFVDSKDELWADNDGRRWCKPRYGSTSPRRCRYERSLDKAVQDGAVLDGRWTVQACLTGLTRCETLAVYDVPRKAKTPAAIAGEPVDAELTPPATEPPVEPAAIEETQG
jgi:hypothetical protein